MFDHVKGVLGRVQGMKSRICFRSKEGCTNRCLRINLSKICPPNRKRCSGYGHGYIPDGFEKQGTSVKISIKQLLHERHVFLGCLIFCYFYIPINRNSLVIFSFLFAFSHSLIGNFPSFPFAFSHSLIGNFPSLPFRFRG